MTTSTATAAYTLLELAPPTTPGALPRERLSKKIRIDHEQNMKRLKRFAKGMAKQQFWVEVAVLDRTFYKLSNSQRLFPRFRVIAQVRQLCKRLKRLAIDQVVARFLQAFWSTKSAEGCQGVWNFIPSKELAEYTMHRIIAATLVLDRLQALLIKSFHEQTKTLRIRHFAGLMLVYMGLSSRLYRLAHMWATELQQCYEMIQAWHAAFPSGIKAKNKANGSDDGAARIDYACLPDTCVNARRMAMQAWSGQTEIPGIFTPLQRMPAVSKPETTARDTPTMMMDDDLDLGEVIERPV